MLYFGYLRNYVYLKEQSFSWHFIENLTYNLQNKMSDKETSS